MEIQGISINFTQFKLVKWWNEEFWQLLLVSTKTMSKEMDLSFNLEYKSFGLAVLQIYIEVLLNLENLSHSIIIKLLDPFLDVTDMLLFHFS